MDDTTASLNEAGLADRLLIGAIDLHQHGYPEISLACRTRTTDVENLIASRSAGFAGIVLKSHFFPHGRASVPSNASSARNRGVFFDYPQPSCGWI
jgi:hypothetical protein